MIDSATGFYFAHASIKGVVLRMHGRQRQVLLVGNPRNKWELPGGWPDRADQRLTSTVTREVLEETGIFIQCGPVVGATLFRSTPEADPVVIVALLCFALNNDEPRPSTEIVGWFSLDSLPDALESPYGALIDAAVARLMPCCPDNVVARAREAGYFG